MRTIRNLGGVDFVGWKNPDGTVTYTESEHSQSEAITTTPEELKAFNSGHCPKCGDRLAGEGDIFCVNDQIYWKTGEGS